MRMAGGRGEEVGMVKENVITFGLFPIVAGLFWGIILGAAFDDPNAGLIAGAITWAVSMFTLAFFRGAYAKGE